MTQPQQNPGSRTIASQTLRPGTTRLLCALHTLPRLYLPYPDMWSGCTLLATSLNVCVLSMLVQGETCFTAVKIIVLMTCMTTTLMAALCLGQCASNY